jgi:hypothetical protein
MKYPHSRIIASLAIGSLAIAVSSTASAQSSAGKPIVISPPAVKDGSNWSRAPFPAQRQFDDTKPADGKAIDETGPNSPVANIEPLPPAARVAVLQPTPAPTITGDPGLLPTGRTTVVVATPLEVTTFGPSIRSMTIDSRNQMFTDIETRVKNSEHAMASLRSTTSQMSAEGRQQFTAASDEVKEKAKALRKSLKDARRATDAQWDSTRAQLAADYEAYAAAVARVDAATGATVR